MAIRKFAFLVVLGLMATACGNGSGNPTSSGPKHGGTLTVAIGIDPDTLDPAAQTTTTASQVVDMMVERLYTLTATAPHSRSWPAPCRRPRRTA